MAEISRKCIVATKLADGSVQFLIQNGNSSRVADPLFVIASFNMPAADVTSLNTTVNGGATGATLTFNYGQRFGTGAAGDPTISEGV